MSYVVLFACVLGISAGQLLFKIAARSNSQAEQIWQIIMSPALISAIFIYGIATLAWVWQLRQLPLVKAYPFMALSFAIVPLASTVLLQESVRPHYWSGIILILTGILFTIA